METMGIVDHIYPTTGLNETQRKNLFIQEAMDNQHVEGQLL